MDTIFIKDLHVRSVIGLNDWERDVKQDVLINAELEYDTRKAGLTDNMNDSLNYKSVCKRIINLVENSEPFLIEKLINNVAKTLLQEFDIHKLTLTIEKPTALRFSKSVGVRITRQKSDYA